MARVQWTFTVLLFFISVAFANAGEVRSKFDLQLNGIYRTISQSGFTEANSMADGILFFGTQILLTDRHFEFEVRHEFRSVFGDTPTYPTGDIARLGIRSPDRFIHADRVLAENNQLELISDIERLRASYVFSAGELWVGRRPISLGTLSFFKIWNKFNRPISGLFGPVIVFGSDGFGGSFQTGSFSLRGVSLFGSRIEDDAHLLEATSFNSFAEIRLLGGHWWDHSALGLAFSKTVFDWMFRFESLYLGHEKQTETEVGLGLDGAIGSDFSVLFETYYQSNGAIDTAAYSVTGPSRFTNLRARFYSIGFLNWQMGTLWKLGLGDLLNGVDGGQIGILKLNYSWSDEVEILGEVNFPFAKEGAEFSKRTFVFKDGNYLGGGSQFTLGLKAAF